ncbi:hypothetical protein Sango_1577900 [Sesamum angolense]|uniref:Reverse transcriptase zinc-binding domain-containing protein n=1 Tax=Sesamum angolense TaxID=2727404 RepID=A0AAE2BTV6_9LAMI|nr:hypothetical protein Sango_1577900 [Sesamum angolense]
MITKLCRRPITVHSKLEEAKLRAEIEGLLAQEEVFWKQRGKVHWLREGDRNTAFFHNQARVRRRTNDISRIKDGTGEWLVDAADIQRHIEAYFGDIFRSRNPSEKELEQGTSAISAWVSEQMVHEILQPYTAEEVSKALSQMAPLKSPGPDVSHYLKTKKWGKEGHMALKLDISKAYDKVEWKFLAKWEERNGRLRGVVVCRQAPEYPTFYLPTTLILYQATVDAALGILEVLDTFGRAAGQEINFAKSSVVFRSIRDRIWQRIGGWNERNLSQAGKEVLIKAVAQAIPTGRSPFFTWRSILAAQQMVRGGGFRWRISSGRSVYVWDDLWIPWPFSFRILLPRYVNAPNMRVCDLIDASTRERDFSLVHELFWKEEADTILAIPLSKFDGDDFIVWHHTACGKIRVFTWKLAQNALPLGVNLQQRMQDLEVVCPLCQHEEEDTSHAFLQCPFARQVWCISHLRWAIVSDFSSDACGWLEHLAKNFSRADFESVITICWAIWWNRNRSLKERTFMPAGEILSFAVNYLSTFQDSDGACVWWKSIRKRWLPEPEMVEAVAAREAVFLARRFGWRKIVVEGDCPNLHRKLISHQPDCSSIGAVIRDIRCLAADFDLCSFLLVCRAANKMAHCLARTSTSSGLEGPYFPLCWQVFCL